MQAKIRLIHAHSAPRCQHIKTNGLRCQSPAMKQRRLCYYHEQHRLTHPGNLQLPLLEDANAIQMAIQQVVQAIALGTLDNKRAGLILYGLQTAAINLPNCDFEPGEDEQDEEEEEDDDYEEDDNDNDEEELDDQAEDDDHLVAPVPSPAVMADALVRHLASTTEPLAGTPSDLSSPTTAGRRELAFALPTSTPMPTHEDIDNLLQRALALSSDPRS